MNRGWRGSSAPARTVGVAMAGALGLVSCVGSGAIVRIETNPEGAEAALESGASCITPCTLRMRDTTRLSISKIGYKTRIVDLQPSPVNLGTTLRYDLQLISASKPVEESGLPDVEAAAALPGLVEPEPSSNSLVMDPIGPRSAPAPQSTADGPRSPAEEPGEESTNEETPEG